MIKAVFTGIGVFLITMVGIWILGWFGNAASVAKKEFSPEASLKKYEWFKDTAQQATKLSKDILIYEAKQELCVGQRDRVIMEQCMLWSQEVAGIKSAYNDVVAEYNAQSSKFNWSMYNVDSIPISFKEK